LTDLEYLRKNCQGRGVGMSVFHLKLAGKEIKVRLENDYYGETFWERFQNNQYEPDTQTFVAKNSNSKTDFMDIGAANGAVTMLAALHGARVKAYEPDPTIFEVLQRNIQENSSLQKLVTLDPAAVSDKADEIYFDLNSNPEILSSILFSNNQRQKTRVKVRNLADEISSFHQDSTRILIIKMDIEGAEWKILRNNEVLKILNQHKVRMLLAVHPGFARPIPRIARYTLFTRAPWLIQQIIDSISFYSKISHFAKVHRTNLNPVINRYKFALLVIAGYHEFIIDFSNNLE
jgi:FkbM family methyltransferase